MLRMINKFLCWMWCGHQYEKKDWSVRTWAGEIDTFGDGYPRECKHCGDRYE